MKTIGFIGGLSWQSTKTYYERINTEVNKRLGKNHSAKILMYSFDFDEIELLQYRSDWEKLNALMASAGITLENAGADCLLICSNTMHECADYIKNIVHVPLLHIVDSVGDLLSREKIGKTGLLGTKFLMQSDIYEKRLKIKYGIETVLPDQEQIEDIHNIIYTELIKGIFKDSSRKAIISIIKDMMNASIGAIILGCTEIPLLIKQSDCEIPVVDTTDTHARSAVNFVIHTSTNLN